MSKYQSITIRRAMEMIHRGQLLLPSFQRDFVWKHEQVEMLFDSLMRGYPIGSLLFWRLQEDSGSRFRFYRFLNNYTEKYRMRSEEVVQYLSHSDYAVLDGQQRLTALNIGLNGTFAYRKKYAWERLSENNYPTRRLYLDISRRYEGDDDGKEYHFEFLAGHTEDLFADGERLWMRVGVASEKNKEQKWAFATEHNLTHEQTKILDDLWDLIWKDETISYYEEETQDPDVAVDVFSRINSGGTRLPLSDILMAMMVAGWQKRDARREIGQLVDDVNHKDFYIGGDYVLKAMLYLFCKDVRFKIANFEQDFISQCEEEWPQVRDAIVSVFALMQSFGLRHSSVSSYYTTLPVLHYLYWSSKYGGIVSASMYSSERTVIRRWLMKSLLLRTFGYRSDTALRAARRVLKGGEWLTFPAIEIEQALGQSVTDDDFYEQVLSCQYESRQAWAVMSLLYSDLQFENVHYELDHIHPRAQFDKSRHQWEVYNSVLNLQLLSDSDNKLKSDKPLEQWVQEKTTSCDRDGFLESRLIPARVDLSIDNLDAFVEARKRLLIERMKIII